MQFSELDIAKTLHRTFKPRERQNVWQWAEKNVLLSARASPWPGPYRTDICPYVKEPMENHTDYSVRYVVLCWSSRSSKTETLLMPIRYSIACDPQPFLIVMPNDKIGRTFSRSRFQPSIDDCPILAAEKQADPNLYSTTEMHFKRCSGWITGANSPANVASKGIGNLLCDEIDKFPQQQTRESGALQLALERIKERWNAKAYLSSTPTVESAQIWIEFLSSDQRYYYVPCVNCGHSQKLVIDQLKWSHDAKRGEFNWDYKKVRETTRYECEKCGFGHKTQHKTMLLRNGVWRATNSDGDPQRRGYHLNALYPTWLSFEQVAVAYLQSFASPEEKQNFHNSWISLPIGSSEDRLRFEKEIAARAVERADLPAGYVAMMTVDVQRDHLYYVVRAHNRDKDSIGLEYGQLPGFEEAEVVAKRWKVMIAAVDSAYAARQREVLEWCASHQGWIPLLGSPGLIGPLRWVEVPIDGGLMRGRKVRTLRIRSNDWKEILHERIANQSPKWIIGKDFGDDYKKHMSAETRHVRRGPRGSIMVEYIPHGRHDWKDCEVYQIALFEAVRGFIFDVPDIEQLRPKIEVNRIDPNMVEHAEIAEIRRQASLTGAERDQVW